MTTHEETGRRAPIAAAGRPRSIPPGRNTMTTDPTPESARALLYRHGLPEDVIDGVLCLHAQELAALQRREAAVWGVDTAAGKHILAAAALIDPTRTASAGLGVSATPSHTDQAALPCRAAVLHRLGSTFAAHGPHQWTVQSGMEPVHCPGTGAPVTDQAAVALAEDLRYLLNYRGPGHDHERPGVWDTSGMPCGHCARLEVARRNLAAYDAGRPAVPPPADRAAVLRDFLWRLEQSAGDAAAEKLLDDNPELRRLADEAQQQEHGRSDVGTEFVRQTDQPDETGLAAFEADLGCQTGPKAAPKDGAAPEPEPPVHGESVAHLAGLHGRRDQWADDEQDDFVPPAAEGLPSGALDSARNGATMLDAWAEDPHGRNFLAHALVQLARDGWLRTEPGEGFEPVRERDDIPEPQDPATLTDRLRCPQCGEDITDYSEDDHVYRTDDERAYCSGECVVAAHRDDVARQDGEA